MGTSKKILLADDSSVILNIGKKILSQEGFDVVVVKNGEGVINFFKTQQCALLLLDINMPQMDGLNCLKIIRSFKDKDLANVPVIAITGNEKNLSRQYFEDAGFNDYLPKPIDYGILISKVKDLLSKSAS